MALAFAGVVYAMYEHDWPPGIGHVLAGEHDTEAPLGDDAVLKYLAVWLLEYSLSVDNIFVFAVVFRFFAVPRKHQHRVLFWGVLGALVLRGVMIAAGASLLHRFEWFTYIFGGALIFTAVRLLRAGDEPPNPERNLAVRLARRVFPVSRTLEGERFFTRVGGRLAITPMFLVLLVIETTDVIFAVDSIPAALGVTEDPFLVFTSNVFAILGLRSLYFALAAVMDRFHYLKASLVFVLAFIGMKMILKHHYPIPTRVALFVIVGLLSVGLAASLLRTRRIRLADQRARRAGAPRARS
jgi:tellurite resistance protein TerC